MKRWAVWAVFVVAWTVALEAPIPDTESLGIGKWFFINRVFVAKTIHVTAYALLAVLSAWVPLPNRYRAIMMFMLMGHATATELLQNVLAEYTYRGGSLFDVALDHFGIGLGMLASWKWWMRPENDNR